MTSSTGTLSYDETVTSTVARTLETDMRLTLSGTGVKGEWFVNMNDAATPQIDVITVVTSLPVANCYFKVTIAGSVTRTYTYNYLTSSSDTAITIAAELAGLISRHPDISAIPQTASNANKIDVVGFGGAFTTTVAVSAQADDSAIASKLTATTTAGTGILKLRKVAEATLQLAVENGFPVMQLATPSWYNGANPPVVQSTPGATKLTGPLNLDVLRAVA